MIWKDFSRAFRDGEHSFLSPSSNSWFNYDDQKLSETYIGKLAARRGTALHALACNLIRMKVKLPQKRKTLNMYVNDCIRCNMRPEVKLFYSKYCFGTTDAINFSERCLSIFDLKTGKGKVSFLQLRIYAALFFLSYPEIPLRDVDLINLRIYQNDEAINEDLGIDDILPIMDKIVHNSKMLEMLEEKYDDGFGFDAYGSWT